YRPLRQGAVRPLVPAAAGTYPDADARAGRLLPRYVRDLQLSGDRESRGRSAGGCRLSGGGDRTPRLLWAADAVEGAGRGRAEAGAQERAGAGALRAQRGADYRDRAELYPHPPG